MRLDALIRLHFARVQPGLDMTDETVEFLCQYVGAHKDPLNADLYAGARAAMDFGILKARTNA